MGDGDDDDQGDEDLRPLVSSTRRCDERNAGGACSAFRSVASVQGEMKLPRAPTEASEV
jgi:hypothetical protein